MVYHEDATSDNHDECIYVLFEKDPEPDKLELRAVMNEAGHLNPQYQVFVQDPFAGLLQSFKEGVYYAMDGLMQH